MSTLNFSEELDFRLIFEDDSRQTAGNLRVFLVTLVSNLSIAVKHLDLTGVYRKLPTMAFKIKPSTIGSDENTCTRVCRIYCLLKSEKRRFSVLRIVAISIYVVAIADVNRDY